jgi:hypothetical protein
MSLLQRKARPLKRDDGGFRDDRLFIVACDDTYAPKQYFDFFKIARIQVHIVPTKDGSSAARHVLNRLREFEHEDDDELWMLLDTDHFTQAGHLPGFITAIGDARQRGIHIAISKPCFELWLLLHHVAETAVTTLGNGEETEKMLRSVLGHYNKKLLRPEHYSEAKVRDAIQRAMRLDSSIGGGGGIKLLGKGKLGFG